MCIRDRIYTRHTTPPWISYKRENSKLHVNFRTTMPNLDNKAMQRWNVHVVLQWELESWVDRARTCCWMFVTGKCRHWPPVRPIGAVHWKECQLLMCCSLSMETSLPCFVKWEWRRRGSLLLLPLPNLCSTRHPACYSYCCKYVPQQYPIHLGQ